ncbi:MAG: hypothetical protein CL424_13545, partial [Acidimicrobiaceae bacterium]|nr:hypothetical protein [Acidimicrobiaceae bacterium]
GRLAVPELPVVIAVEDLHVADAGLADLIATLVGGSASVLVVSTSWPGQTTSNAHVRRALDAVGERAVRFDHRSTEPPDPFPPSASLAELDDEALAALVRHHYPVVDDETLDAIVDRYRNPLALELFCGLPKIRRRSRAGALRLERSAIESTPVEVRGLYGEMWSELPEPVREALSLAALGIPALLDPTSAGEWNTELLLAALEQIDWPGLDEIADGLRHGGDAYSWARSVSDMLRTFNESVQRDVAADDDTFLFDDDRSEVRRAIGGVLGHFLRSNPTTLDDAERHHVADLAAVLHAEGLLADPDVLADAVQPSVELSIVEERDLARVIHLTGLVLDAEPAPERRVRALLLRGHAHLVAGRLADALSDADRADSDLDATSGTTALEVLNLRARALTALRRDTDAIETYGALVAGLERALGPDHPDTIAASAGYGLAVGRAGRVDEALVITREAVRLAERTLEPDDPYLLRLRNNLAVAFADAGDIAAALDEFVALEDDAVRTFGPEHPRTLNILRNGAWHRFVVGDQADAVQRLRALAADHDRVLGPAHPDSLRVHRLLGVALAHDDDGGTAQDGVTLLIDTHAREVDVLGWDHPDVQETRRTIADLASASGDHQLAITTLERHVADCDRIFGDGSLPAHTARVHLARALALADRPDDAVRALAVVVEPIAEASGECAEAALVARQLFGRVLAQSGDIEHALAELSRTAELASTRWGRTDDRTIDARDDVARALDQAGRLDDAVAVWERLEQDVAADRGADDQLARQLSALVDATRRRRHET